MNYTTQLAVLLLLALPMPAGAQDATPPAPRREFRSSLSVIEDATIYSNLRVPVPSAFNQLLVEPSVGLRYRHRLTLSTSLAGIVGTHSETHVQGRVKEAYAGLSAGDFDFTLGRRMVRWGVGYAFTAAGVLDPPRVPTNPTDRLNLNQGRDMIKGDYVRGPHALSLAWSSAVLAPARSPLRDTTAFRYNFLVRGFDTSLIAGDDRGGDAFGALTFTRVLGQSWEIHGEAAWREQGALLAGAKCTTRSGVTFIAEFYTPPNTPYFRDSSASPIAGRQRFFFFDVGKNRLRELPGWKEWDVSGYLVANLNDLSYTAILDTNRRFGNRFSAYLHLEIPRGGRTSGYGAAPYSTATSAGIRFQL
jgi:hypothetical protein